jgi:hypothetical protein
MGPRKAYKDMLDNVVSLIACVSMNHQNQLEQMRAMFTTDKNLLSFVITSELIQSKHSYEQKSGNQLISTGFKNSKYRRTEGISRTNPEH